VGRSEAEAAFMIALRPASQSVSAISSLLREVQAALREAARATPETAAQFEGDQPPVLTVRFEGSAEAISLVFEFVNTATRNPLSGMSAAVTKRFITALEAELKRRPQRTLWGQPATAGRRRATEADRDALGARAATVLAELGRMRAAFVSGAGRRIRIEGDTAEIL
jgi:hypothetical protein